MRDIQLCNISGLGHGKYVVTAYADDGKLEATFTCPSEADAIRLRSAIRESATELKQVFDFRRDKR
jgi:hypothetical protein